MLFQSSVPKQCSLCLHSTQTDEETLQCPKRGTVSPEDHCLRFRYDPCKRIPPRPKALNFNKYEEEDYSL